MTARRTAAPIATVSVLVGMLAFAGAAAPASALGEPDGLYSASDSEDGTNGFVQLDKTDATATAIGPVSDQYFFSSVEVVNGVGYAIGYVPGNDDIDDVFFTFTWSTSTGALLSAVPATVGGEPVVRIYALDTTNDGVFLTYLEDGPGSTWIASVDFATGAVTPLVDTDDAGDDRIFEGLATNPVTGVTYALADYDDGVPAYSTVDLATGVFGDSVLFPQIADELGEGWFSEGDFDATGVLWFTYTGDVGVARTDGPAEVGVEAEPLGDPDIVSKAITIGQTVAGPEPQLAATGADSAPLALAAGALLVAGAGLVLARRRQSA